MPSNLRAEIERQARSAMSIRTLTAAQMEDLLPHVVDLILEQRAQEAAESAYHTQHKCEERARELRALIGGPHA